MPETTDELTNPPAATNVSAVGGTVHTDLTEDYASAGYTVSTAYGYAEALPDYIDDLSQREGSDLYERMACDAQVFGDTGALRRSVLASGYRLSLPEGEEENPRAEEIRQFCVSALSELETPLIEVMDDLLWAIGLGSRVAHLVWRQDGRYILPHYAKPILRRDFAYVSDNRGRLIGIEAQLAGRPDKPLLRGPLPDLNSLGNVLPRSRFLHYRWGAAGMDPRGASQYRAAYNAWWRKRQAEVELGRFLSQIAGGAVVVELPDKAVASPKRNPDGSVVLGPNNQPVIEDPADSALKAGDRYRNGAFLVLKGGATAKILTADSAGGTFFETFSQCNTEISHAILHQSLATNEGQHQTRAATGSHKDLFDLLADYGEQTMCRTINRDLLRDLVRYNFGDEAVALTPLLHLSAAEEADVEGLTKSYAAVGYKVAPEHLAEIDAKLGLSPRLETTDPTEGETDPAADFSDLRRKKKVVR
jgi:hypothetical protein